MISETTDSTRQEHSEGPGRLASLFGFQALLLCGVLFLILDGWHRDFRVPLAFSNDALEYLMQSKGTIENGWWWTHPRLSAPWGFSEIAYPSNTNVDQAVVWFIGLFIQDVGLCLNVAWLVLVVASGSIMTACLMRLGLSKRSSFVAGVLFALSPYAFLRNVDHFSLVTYLIPIACAAALLVGTGRIGAFRARSTLPFVIGMALLGFNYIYYAFFGCFLMVVATATAAARGRARTAWRTGVLLTVTTCAATSINLLPSVVAWSRDGKPLAIESKTPREAEIYGLTIRHLLGPVDGHVFPPLRQWATLQRMARFPLDSENTTARLGVVGATGFIVLLCLLILRRKDDRLEDMAAILMLCAVLIGTAGGFGTLFSLLVSADIRAYNRIAPFIHFFSLVGVAHMLDWGASRWRRAPGRPALWLAGAVLVVGIYDQAHAALPMNGRYEIDRAELAGLRSFVTTLEATLPPGALVFQLPVTGFPIGGPSGQMRSYDAGKPYLVSRTLHWSFPSFADGLARWQRHVGDLPTTREICAAIRAAGFSALVIDRRGYVDGGNSFLDEIRPDLPRAILAEDERYIALDVTRIATAGVDAAKLPRLSSPFGPASAGLPSCGSAEYASIDIIGGQRGPFQDTPVDAPWFGDIGITGWAADGKSGLPAKDVDIALGEGVFPTFYGISRVDVAQALSKPGFQTSGFTTRIPRDRVSPGLQPIVLRIVSTGGDCYYESPPLALRVR